jgi:hypothetical protein
MAAFQKVLMIVCAFKTLYKPHNDQLRSYLTCLCSKAATKATERVIVVSYNIVEASITSSILDDMKADWMNLVDKNNQITVSD